MHWRVAILAILVLVVAGLIVIIKSTTWSQLSQLRRELAAVRGENYYLGIRLQNGVDRLKGALLRQQLSRSSVDSLGQFRRESRELMALLERTLPQLTTSRETELAQEWDEAFRVFLTNSQPLLERSLVAVRRDSAAQVHQEIEQLAQPLERIGQAFIVAQDRSWAQLLAESDRTLKGLHQLSFWSLAALLLFGLASLCLIYHATIIPLQQRLNETQAVIERQEKLASLGTLAAGVAHEIRNPLTAIKFRLFSLKKALPPEFATHEDAQVIAEEINRLERIVRDFLAFARPSTPQRIRFPADQVLRRVQDLMSHQLESHSIALKLEAAETFLIEADPQQLEQVLINLVQNAADSIVQNGMITMRIKQGPMRYQARLQPAVLIEVADTGKGIPPDVQKRLFDPFFSTKEGGTGLGLAIAERIMEKHGGLLQYQTRPDKGTIFQIILPQNSSHASANSAY